VVLLFFANLSINIQAFSPINILPRVGNHRLGFLELRTSTLVGRPIHEHFGTENAAGFRVALSKTSFSSMIAESDGEK
jgi:hypothetical protein